MRLNTVLILSNTKLHLTKEPTLSSNFLFTTRTIFLHVDILLDPHIIHTILGVTGFARSKLLEMVYSTWRSLHHRKDTAHNMDEE